LKRVQFFSRLARRVPSVMDWLNPLESCLFTATTPLRHAHPGRLACTLQGIPALYH
jgi:hypothetical protein